MGEQGTMKLGVGPALHAVMVAALLLLAAVPSAQAQEIELVDRSRVENGNYEWRYLVDPGSRSTFWNSGTIPTAGTNPEDFEPRGSIRDYVTIYDFTGLAVTDPLAVQVDTRFDYRFYSTGSTPQTTTPVDTVDTNVTIFRSADPPLITRPFTFSIRSVYGGRRIGYYSIDATRRAPGALSNRTGVSVVGRVEVPRRPAP